MPPRFRRCLHVSVNASTSPSSYLLVSAVASPRLRRSISSSPSSHLLVSIVATLHLRHTSLPLVSGVKAELHQRQWQQSLRVLKELPEKRLGHVLQEFADSFWLQSQTEDSAGNYHSMNIKLQLFHLLEDPRQVESLLKNLESKLYEMSDEKFKKLKKQAYNKNDVAAAAEKTAK